ncbi:hypothetical protein DL96DRAFT_1636410 [Flagelloscypha sp. PMI_526]|nr:hypothetical protein DL96DRAFT_1636410 [Flagelloscypha sp. PMI_526]
MAPHLPHELWSKIYNYFVDAATKRSELIPCMLVHSLAHDIISPRLFETFISHPSFSSPAEAFFTLSQRAQNSCIKRLYIDHRQDIRPYLFDLSRVMEQGRDSIERLYYIAPPESGIDSLVASLRNLTFLQITLLQFMALQREAEVDHLLWAESLEKLYFDLGCKVHDGPNDERIYNRKLSKALNLLDLSMFPRLTHVVFHGICILETIKETITRLLADFSSIQLFIIVDTVLMLKDRVREEKYLLPSRVHQDDRVLYYQSNNGRLVLELVFASVRERPVELLWRPRRPWDGSPPDVPFDDWGEITTRKQLHIWGWADSVYRTGKKIFGLEMGDALEFRSWIL